MSKSSEKRARKTALWLLYAVDVTDGSYDDALELCKESMGDVMNTESSQWEEVSKRVLGVSGAFDDLNTKIQDVSPRWKVARMAPIDRNILRLAAWEILIDGAVPLPVINACVDLGKEYGEKTTPGFINGLLDELCKANSIVLKP